MKSEKKLMLLLSFLMIIFLLTAVACNKSEGGSKTNETKDSPQVTQKTKAEEQNTSPVNIRMWTFLDPNGTSPREIVLSKIIDSFQQNNSGIKIIVEPQQWDIMTAKFFAAHSAGNAPDIQWVSQDEFGAALKLNALTPFEDMFLDSWSQDDIKDVDDGFWKLGIVDGKHYQVTLSRNTFVLYYRSDLFEEKNIKAPIKTWEELIEAAKLLTEEDSEKGFKRWGLGMGFATEKGDPQIAPFTLLTEQGDLFTKDGKANYANDIGKKALQLEVDMILKHKVTPEDSISYSAEDVYADFCAGKFAIVPGAGVRVSDIKSKVTFNPDYVKVMPYPSWDGKPSMVPISGWSVGVWSGSKYKIEAGKFVEAMFSKEADEMWLLEAGQVPVRKSTIEKNKEYLSTPDKEYLKVLAEVINNGYPYPTDYPIVAYKNDFLNATQRVITGKATIEEALKEAEIEFNKRNSAIN